MNARHKAMLQLSRTSACDVLIVGGGATGLGVALEASRRGHSVVLAEAHDYASGTSSKATKLLHGGVRYLAQGRIHLVMEALAQRRRILALAPHVAQALAFVVPVYKHWHMPFYAAGLKAYEHLARSSSLGPTEWLSPSATLDALPLVNPTGLLGGIRYWDAQFDDARLAIELVKMAQRHGAQLFNYLKVTRLDAPQNGWRNVQLTDVLTQQAHHIKARCVINATGVWTDDMQRLDAAAAQPTP
jgi:glycerol-3-phosphate dehydrogenase